MRPLTLLLWLRNRLCVITLKSYGVCSQASFQNNNCLPSPICHLKLCLNISVACKMLLHTKEIYVFTFASKKGTTSWYFSFDTLATKEEGFCKIFQPCFVSSAKLKASNSQNPIPPSYFVLHVQLQFFQQISLLLSFCPHQNFLIS